MISLHKIFTGVRTTQCKGDSDSLSLANAHHISLGSDIPFSSIRPSEISFFQLKGKGIQPVKQSGALPSDDRRTSRFPSISPTPLRFSVLVWKIWLLLSRSLKGIVLPNQVENR